MRRALALLLPWDSVRSSDLYRLPAKTLVCPCPLCEDKRHRKGGPRGARNFSPKPLSKRRGLPEIVIAFADYENPNR